MSIYVALHHVTHYKYDRPIDRPADHPAAPGAACRTPILSYSLKVAPSNHFVNWQQDPHGNWLARYVFPEKTTELKIEVDFTAQMTMVNPFDFFVEPYADTFRSNIRKISRPSSRPISRPSSPIACSRNISTRSRTKLRTPSTSSSLSTGSSAKDRLRHPHGGGRADAGGDAVLGVRLVPRLGLAAGPCAPPSRPRRALRLRLPDPVEAGPRPLDGPLGTEKDFTDLHAWAEVYLPGAGWIGLDPTSGLLRGEGHIPLAATPHYRSAAPISGGAGCRGRFRLRHEVTRVAEPPRITKPFSDEAGRASTRSATRSTPTLQRRTCA